MRIDIWLDIRCPNCYIAKRKFQLALDQFQHKEGTHVNWRSYELSPTLTSQPGKTVYEYLAELKGRSLEWSEQMHRQVAEAAAQVGLVYNFDKAVIANSFDAHRLVQYAKSLNKASETIDRLYYAYFTEGADLADRARLEELGISAGLPSTGVREVLSSGRFANEVRADEKAAEKIVRGVPFFLFNNLRTVSGGHSVESFLLQLQEGWQQYLRLVMDPPGAGADEACPIDGFC
jgi:predicted DsbA family dithiol-disulfide isomerase